MSISPQAQPATSATGMTPPASPGVPPSPLLGAKLAAMRRKGSAVALLTGLATLVAVGLEVLALVMFFDWWLELPWGVRFLLLLGLMGLLGWLAWQLTGRPLWRQPSDDELALRVEKAHPDLRGRLIASVQLTRPGAIPAGASAGLVDAMVEETEAMAAPLDFSRIISTDRLKKLGLFAAIIAGLALLGLVLGRPTTTDLLRRAFLSNTPVPRKTRVMVVEGDKVIGRGDNIRLEAVVRGVIPSHGKLTIRSKGRRDQVFPLEQSREDRTRFGRTIENVQDSFTYQVRLNDGVSPWHQVKTVARPTVATITCEQEFPAYTGLPRTKRMLGDLSLLAGSKLKLTVTATKDLQSAAIKGSGLDLTTPLQMDPANRRLFAGELAIPAQGLNGFSIQMRDIEGMESRDAAVYRVEIIPDKPPVVRVTYPDRKEELITRQATMLVGMELLDDFALAKVRLRYRVEGPGHSASEQTVELDLESQEPQRLRRHYPWNLGALNPPLTEGNRIEYWIEAVDNNNATGPGVGASDHHYAKVVTAEEKRADLLNRAGDYLGSITDVAGDQDRLNRSLGTIIREKRILR